MRSYCNESVEFFLAYMKEMWSWKVMDEQLFPITHLVPAAVGKVALFYPAKPHRGTGIKAIYYICVSKMIETNVYFVN